MLETIRKRSGHCLAAAVFGALALSAIPARAQDEEPEAKPAAPAKKPAVKSEETSTPVEATDDSRPKLELVPNAEPVEQPGGEHREVNGHRFITPIREGFTAFTNSSILFEQGFGVYNSAKAALLAYDQLFGAQIAVMNRVSIDIRAKGLAAVGADQGSLYVKGALANLEAGAMPKVRIITIDSVGFTAAVGVNLAYFRGIEVTPERMVTFLETHGFKALNNAVTAGVTNQEAFEVEPAFLVAEGIGPVGLQVSAFPRITVGNQTTSEMLVDLHLAFDVSRLTKYVPIAFVFEYEPNVPLQNSGTDVDHGIAAGIYYSGRRDFNFGAYFSTDQQPAATQYGGGMTLQYYF